MHGIARKNLIGSWRLASYTATSAKGTFHPMGEGAVGVLNYSPSGKVSVHIMARDGRYFAYYGDYTVDERSSAITHHLEMASDPSFVGASNLRHAKLEGRRLVLSGAMTFEGEPGKIEVAWERQDHK